MGNPRRCSDPRRRPIGGDRLWLVFFFGFINFLPRPTSDDVTLSRSFKRRRAGGDFSRSDEVLAQSRRISKEDREREREREKELSISIVRRRGCRIAMDLSR